MVKIDVASKIDEKKFPFSFSWDSDVRQNFSTYQNKIDQLTYHLQRSQRNIWFTGEWFYPKFFQKDLLLLEVYKAKQFIGKINQEEVDHYRRINPLIGFSLNKTFGINWPIPFAGVAVGGGLFVFAHLFNYAYSFRLGFFLVPVLFDIFWQLGDKGSYLTSLQFMNWLAQYRTARARLEFDAHKLNKDLFDKYHKTVNSKAPVEDIWRNFVELVEKETKSD